MSEQEHKREFVELQKVNADLSSSLDRCRAILLDCRKKLAANSNRQVVEQESEGHG